MLGGRISRTGKEYFQILPGLKKGTLSRHKKIQKIPIYIKNKLFKKNPIYINISCGTDL